MVFALALCYVKNIIIFCGLLSRDDYFSQIIFCEKETIVAVLAQHIFDLSIAVDMKQRVVPCLLHLNEFVVGEMVATEGHARINGGVKEGEHKTARLHYLMNA